MKTIAVALVMMLAGVIATPYQAQNVGVRNTRVIDEIINGIFDGIKELLDGLDPYIVEYAGASYSIPLLDRVISAEAYVNNFQAAGFSGILNNGISLADNTLTFNLVLPDVEVTAEDAVASLTLLNREIKAEIRGRLAIKGISVTGEVNMDGFDLILDLGLERIDSELEVIIFGRDISDSVNKYLSQTLPATLKEFKEQLNRQIAVIIKYLINRLFD